MQLELPYAAIGLVWNSMMSVAGGWFFLMACEMFVLGNRDLRLPGLGSYLQTAANAGDIRAIVWGIAVMIAVIVSIDQLIWRPVIAWSEKFKFEQVEASEVPRSPILTLLRRSTLLQRLLRTAVTPFSEALTLHLAASAAVDSRGGQVRRHVIKWAAGVLAALGVAGIVYATSRIGSALMMLSRSQVGAHLSRGRGYVPSRRAHAGCWPVLWTIPVGVFVGLRPRLAAIAQPIAQVAASVPATALFPIVVLFLIRVGGGLGIGSIDSPAAGHAVVHPVQRHRRRERDPHRFERGLRSFPFGLVERWRRLFLPGIFPVPDHRLRHGIRRSVEREHRRRILPLPGRDPFHHRPRRGHQPGDRPGNFPVLLGATVVMAAMVVTVNRLLWRRLYAFAATRYKLES